MKKVLKWKMMLTVLFSMCLFLIASVSVGAESLQRVSISGTRCYDMAAEVLSLVNRDRTANGTYNTLTMPAELQEAAMKRAEEIAVYYSHTRPNGEECYTAFPSGFSAAGENIAAGQRSADEVEDDWMHSDGHRRNILNSAYNQIGIGCFCNNGRYYWVQAFTNKTSSNSYQTGRCQSTASIDVLDSKIQFVTEVYPQNIYENESVEIAIGSNNGFTYCMLNNSCASFSSSDTSVATVSPTGIVTGRKPGTAVITATLGSTHTAQVTVQVGHKVVTDYMVSPTCTKAGKTQGSHCANCGKIMTAQTTVPALGHVFTDNKCFRCREYQTLAKPVLSKAENVTTGVKITWKVVADAQKYGVYRRPAGGSWTKLANATTTSYIDKTAKSGMVYDYTVRCISADGLKMISTYDTVGLRIKALSAITPTLANAPTGVKVSWAKVAGATGYRVYRKTGTAGYQLIKTIASGATVSYTDTAAVSGTTYTYAVRATYGTTYGSYTGKSVYYLKAITPSSLTKTTTGVTVKWAKVAGATGYYIYRKLGDGSYAKIKIITNASTVSFTDTAVKGKKGTYWYAVRAYKGSVLGSYVGKSIILK